jgi:hypothetical protein
MAVIEAFGPGRIGIKRIDFLQVDHVIQLGRESNRIDILTGISGVRFDEAWDTREQGKIADAPYLSLAEISLERRCVFLHTHGGEKNTFLMVQRAASLSALSSTQTLSLPASHWHYGCSLHHRNDRPDRIPIGKNC